VDSNKIKTVCLQIISANQNVVSKYRSTKKVKHFNKLVGEVKKLADEKFDMKKVTDTLQKLIEESK